jgi:AraC family transcriptional activator of pobA
MKSKDILLFEIKSIMRLHELMAIGKPKHPLIGLRRFEDTPQQETHERIKLISDFYQVTLKRQCPCKLQYGQSRYDFNEGVMSFFSPKQVSIIEPGTLFPPSGWLLSIHPDFLNHYPLAKKIKDYGFFDYAMNEALIMSDEEEKVIVAIFENIEREYQLPIDNFSQDVLVTNVELLLTHCNRFYTRQFISRKPTNQSLLIKVEKILKDYFDEGSCNNTLPSAAFIASQLNISPKYLSDCLKQLTGQSIQQHIHDKLIQKAKEQLGNTEFTVAEIAYQLGFEYPQSFNKLFKSKTNISPLAYRKLLN